MNEIEELERILSATSISPHTDQEHKGLLRKRLRARARRLRVSRPLLAVAVVAVMLGATFLRQPALESTGLQLDTAEIVDDGVAALMTHAGAGSGFGLSQHESVLTSGDLDGLRAAFEDNRRAYLEGRLPLTRATGLTFGGFTEFDLEYGGGAQSPPFPVTIGRVERSERYERFIRSPAYGELWRRACAGDLGPASIDTLMLNGSVVVMSTWRLVEPEFGAVEIHLGDPLN